MNDQLTMVEIISCGVCAHLPPPPPPPSIVVFTTASAMPRVKSVKRGLHPYVDINHRLRRYYLHSIRFLSPSVGCSVANIIKPDYQQRIKN